MLKRFYVAGSFTNFALVRGIAELLKEHGWLHTYDWTSVETEAEKDKPSIAVDEINAVVTADLIIVVISPNKAQRGTHCEIGAALATGKKILLFAQDEAHIYADGYTCVFHQHPKCQVLISSDFTPIAIVNAVIAEAS